MVDFALTAADETLLSMITAENCIGQTFAREQDRTRETEIPRICKTHSAVADLEAPFEALERLAAQTSGQCITEALMRMAGATDADLRDDPHAAFGNLIIDQWGTAEQKSQLEGKRFAIGLTEPEAGSDPMALRSTARWDPASGHYLLNGEKIFISFFQKFDGAVVLAREVHDDGRRPIINAFVVTRDLPGISEGPQMRKLGMRKHDISSFSMTDVPVSPIGRLDADLGRVLSKFNHNRPLVAAVALGSARSLLDFTRNALEAAGHCIDYSISASRRSGPVERFIRLEALHEAACGTVLRAKWLEHTGQDYLLEASVAKAVSGRAVRLISQECLDLLGAESLSEAYLAEKWLRDVRIADIYEGAGEVQRILIARTILGYQRELS